MRNSWETENEATAQAEGVIVAFELKGWQAGAREDAGGRWHARAMSPDLRWKITWRDYPDGGARTYTARFLDNPGGEVAEDRWIGRGPTPMAAIEKIRAEVRAEVRRLHEKIAAADDSLGDFVGTLVPYYDYDD